MILVMHVDWIFALQVDNKGGLTLGFSKFYTVQNAFDP
jgi:hypothetical protein